MEVLTALTVLVGGAGVYLATKIFPNFSPGNRRVDRDLQKMKEEIESWNLDLVPLEKDDLELFSLNQEKHSLKKGFTTTAKGVFTTIFHEPIFAYSYKQYISSKSNALLFVKTARHQYVFRLLKKGIQVGIDSYLIGTLKEDGGLYGDRKGKKIARIRRDQKDIVPIIVGEREVAGLIKDPDISKQSGLSTRAFEFVRSDLKPQEEAVFMAIVTLELVLRIVKTD